MSCIRTLARVAVATTAIVGLTASSNAVPISKDGFPAPGGTAFVGTGTDTGSAGGAGFDFSGFDFGAFDQLWWGLDTAYLPEFATDGAVDTAGESLSFAGAAGSTASWTGQTSFTHSCDTGCTTDLVNTRFTITLSGAGASAFFPSSDLLVLDAGFDTSQSVLTEVTGDFGVTFLYEVFFGGSWQPVFDLFDAEQTPPTSNLVVTSHGGSFYSTAVPEPGAALLVGLAVAAVLATRTRRA
jgi:hypothetical protein